MELAPFFADVADGPVGGVAYWRHADDGVRLRLTHWPNADAKGTVLIFTGRTEFAEKYGRAARELLAAGYTVLAIDWRGQGMSDRLHDDHGLGHVGRFSDYYRDADAMVAAARDLDLPRPHYLLGHSLGGGIGLGALMRGLDVRAVFFSAPMFGINAHPVRRGMVMGLSALAGALGQSARVVPGLSTAITIAQTPFAINELTHDPDQYAFLQEQVNAHPELALGAPSLHWIREAVKETDRLNRKPSPDVPTLTMVGTEETIVDPRRIQNRMRRWPNGRLEVVPGGRHEMLVELPEIRARVVSAMLAHFAAHP